MAAVVLHDWFELRGSCHDDDLQSAETWRNHEHLRLEGWRRLKDVLLEADLPEVDHLGRAQAALSRIDDESREEGFPLSSAVAKAAAGRLLEQLARRFRREYDVYPTRDREIAVETGGDRCRVLILIDSAGGATCFVTIDGRNRRARYDEVARLPDAFVVEAMGDLGRP